MHKILWHVSAKDNAVAAFQTLFGTDPAGLWSAPGRANLIGEHTDYNDGLALPFAINHRTVAAVSPRSDRIVSVWSQEGGGDVVEWSLDSPQPSGFGWASYPLGVLSLMAPEGACGLTIALASDVPVGAGLSSSAALECAVAVAARDLWGTHHTPIELAALGARAENDIVGAPTGTMDQLASVLGQKDHAILIDFHSHTTQQVRLAVNHHDVSLVIVDSGQRHDHATGGYGQRRRVCESITKDLGLTSLRDITYEGLDSVVSQLSDEQARLLRHVVSENTRVSDTIAALSTDDFDTVGQLLTSSHRSLRDDFQVSTDYIDSLVDDLVDSGALGARICGGGFGGSVIALTPKSALGPVEDLVASRATAPHALHPPTLRPVTPEDGAGKN
jgi:galactokinase